MEQQIRNTLLPWRYLVPRRRYFQSLRIASTCPEIRGHINRDALYTIGEYLVWIPSVPIYALVFFGFFVLWLAKKLPIPRIPDFNQKKVDTIEEAHRIVPVDEIRRRIGLPVPGRILSKKEVSARSSVG